MEHNIGVFTFKPFGVTSQISIDGNCCIQVKGDSPIASVRWDQGVKRAEFIVTACNEYDTLKAKAELYEKALEKITKHAYKGIVMSTALQALSTAKEL